MNLTGSIESINLSTLQRVKDKSGGVWADSSSDAFIESVIGEVSTAITDYLGFHTLRSQRTEVYELRKFHKHVTVDGRDIAAGESVRIAATPSGFPSATALTGDRDYVVNRGAGSLRLLVSQPYSPGYMQITYTGGALASTSEIGTRFAWLTEAADMQIAYRIQRRDTLGANVQTAEGQGTNFQGGYNFLPAVRAMLDVHRRGGGL